MTDYVTKDSGERAEFESGMQRDTQSGKPRFDLLVPEGVPFEEQLLTRFAALMGRGAEKYAERNWEQANSAEELARMKSSAFRHFMQWLTGETDEDHAAAILFNVLAYETTAYKISQAEEESPMTRLLGLMQSEPIWGASVPFDPPHQIVDTFLAEKDPAPRPVKDTPQAEDDEPPRPAFLSGDYMGEYRREQEVALRRAANHALISRRARLRNRV